MRQIFMFCIIRKRTYRVKVAVAWKSLPLQVYGRNSLGNCIIGGKSYIST